VTDVELASKVLNLKYQPKIPGFHLITYPILPFLLPTTKGDLYSEASGLKKAIKNRNNV